MTDEIGGYLHPTFLLWLWGIPVAVMILSFFEAKIAIPAFILFMLVWLLVWFAIDSRGRLR